VRELFLGHVSRSAQLTRGIAHARRDRPELAVLIGIGVPILDILRSAALLEAM